MHVGLKQTHACSIQRLQLARLENATAVLCSQRTFRLLICLTAFYDVWYLAAVYEGPVGRWTCDLIADKNEDSTPIAKPLRPVDNMPVDSRVATIKQRPTSRCFPPATEANVSRRGGRKWPVCRMSHLDIFCNKRSIDDIGDQIHACYIVRAEHLMVNFRCEGCKP